MPDAQSGRGATARSRRTADSRTVASLSRCRQGAAGSAADANGADMPLRREVGDATEQRDGSIVFTINDGAGTVPCTVTRDALMVLLNDHDHSRRVFLWHRLAIERIARESLPPATLTRTAALRSQPATSSVCFPSDGGERGPAATQTRVRIHAASSGGIGRHLGQAGATG